MMSKVALMWGRDTCRGGDTSGRRVYKRDSGKHKHKHYFTVVTKHSQTAHLLGARRLRPPQPFQDVGVLALSPTTRHTLPEAIW